MPLTNAQRTNFFTAQVQMGLSNVQRVALANEGLITEEDFADFKETELKTAFKNVRSGVPGVPGVLAVPQQVDANGAVIQPAIAAVPAIPGVQATPIPAKCTSRLLIASCVWNYYTETGRVTTQNNMHFTSTLRGFNTEWEAIQTMANQDAPQVPTLTKTNPPLRWCESFKNVCYNTFGVRKVPLLYIIRENVEVTLETGNDATVTYDPCLPNKAHGSSGSVLEDLILRTSHSHPLFKQDNATVFTMIEEAARGSQFATTIQPFKNRKNGRAAWLSLLSSHVGADKWEYIIKTSSEWLMTAKWNGKKFSLEGFCSSHRSKYTQLVEAAQHVSHQVPNGHTRVGYLIDNIEHSDADLRAAIAQVRTNSQGARDDFEKAVAILLPVDPFLKNKANKNSNSFEISGVHANKFGRGKATNVDLRWYKKDEFVALSEAEKTEVRAWQQTPEGKTAVKDAKDAFFRNKGSKQKRPGKSFEKSNKKLKRQVAALQKKIDNQDTIAEVAALFKDNTSTKSNNDEKHQAMARKVMGIVAREKQDS